MLEIVLVFGEGDVKRDTEAMHMEKLSRFHTNMSFLNEIAQLWQYYFCILLVLIIQVCITNNGLHL